MKKQRATMTHDNMRCTYHISTGETIKHTQLAFWMKAGDWYTTSNWRIKDDRFSEISLCRELREPDI
jgi:hypothetical protein